MNIAILDDHELIRIGIAGVLAKTNHTLTISVATPEQLFDKLQNGVPCDILLLDILLPGTNGIDIAKRVRAEYPDIKIIVLSVDTREYTLIRLLQLGIDGFVSKRGPMEEVTRAIESVIDGVPFYGRDISVLIRDITDAKMNKNNALTLTKREQEVIRACCEGLQGKEVAERLHISLRAVNSHKTNIFNKLGISSSLEMVRFALEHGII